MMARLGACWLAVAAVVAGCGSTPADPGEGTARRALDVIAPLPQHGPTLGAADAPARLEVFTSLDAFNAGFFARDLAPIVDRYVRPGRLRLVLRTLPTSWSASGDADAQRAARLAQATGLQDRMWQFLAEQAAGYSGVIEPAALSAALARVGVDRAAAERAARSPQVAAAVARAQRAAGAGAADELPTFALTIGSGPRQRLTASCKGCLERAVARALARPAPAAAPSAEPTPSALALLDGLPRDGDELGAPDARDVMDLYVSVDDFDTAFVHHNLRPLLRRHVAAGDLRLRIHPIPRRPVDDAGARIALAAGEDGRLWDFFLVHAATAGSYRRTLRALPGIDVATVLRRAGRPAIAAAAARAQREADAASITDPPGYVLHMPKRADAYIDDSCPRCVLENTEKAIGSSQP